MLHRIFLWHRYNLVWIHTSRITYSFSRNQWTPMETKFPTSKLFTKLGSNKSMEQQTLKFSKFHLDAVCRQYLGGEVISQNLDQSIFVSESRATPLCLSKHHIFSFIDFRSKVMATTCVWMVCHHHPSMCFPNLICWGTFPAKVRQWKPRDI